MRLDTNLIQSRSCVETFGGGNYTLDMAENLGGVSPLPKADPVLEGKVTRELYRTQRLKELFAYYTKGV